MKGMESTNWDEARRRIAECRRSHAKKLDLRGLYLTTLPGELSALTWLEELDLGYNPELTDAAVRVVAKHCPNLQSLNVRGCKQLTDAAVRAVAEHCPNLQSLNVGACEQLTDDAVQAVAEHCHNLQSLQVYGCKQLTGLAVRAVAKHCPKLQSMDVGECDRLTDADVRDVAEQCPNLLSLDVGWCRRLTDAAVLAVAEHCPNLQSLNVRGCKQLTDAAVRVVAEQCPNLQSLNLTACKQLTDTSVQALTTGVLARSLRSLNLDFTGVRAVPRELIGRADAQAIFEHILRGERPLHAAKLLLVGQGEVGKTHLRRRLLDSDPLYINPREERTHNIEMRPWSVEAPLKDGPAEVGLRLLDFGGQPNLHAAHRFFLNDRRNLYVLVLDATRTPEKNRLVYWLRKIHYHSPAAPVIVLVTKCDAAAKGVKGPGRRLGKLTLEALQQENAAVHDVVDGYGWSEQLTSEERQAAETRHLKAQEKLVAAIKKALPHVPEIDERYVPGFHELLQWLEKQLPDRPAKRGRRSHKALEVRQYVAEAGKYDLSKELALAYLEVYTSLGIVHYVGHRTDLRPRRDIPSGSEVMDWAFNPAWVKGPVYHLVRTPTGEHDSAVLDENGVARRFAQPVERGDERPLWKRLSFEREDSRRILALMAACELCFPFEVDGSRRHLIPDLLPERETLSRWTDRDATRRELAYEFLPENVLLRFIGRRYGWVRDRVGECFRNEVVVRPVDQPSAALVQADYTKSMVSVTVCGGNADQQRTLLDCVANDLADIMQPSTGRWPAPDALGEAAAERQRPRSLIPNGRPTESTTPPAIAQTPRAEYDLFICHASEDKEEVVIPLTEELERRGLSVWVDYKVLLLGDRLRQRIDEGLCRSRFGIVIVSPHFFAKKWPQAELDGLVALEMADGRKRILPLWHNVDSEYVARHSPTLAGRLAADWSAGLPIVIDDIARAVS